MIRDNTNGQLDAVRAKAAKVVALQAHLDADGEHSPDGAPCP